MPASPSASHARPSARTAAVSEMPGRAYCPPRATSASDIILYATLAKTIPVRIRHMHHRADTGAAAYEEAAHGLREHPGRARGVARHRDDESAGEAQRALDSDDDRAD